MRHGLPVLLFLCACPLGASAQFGDDWVRYVRDDARLPSGPTLSDVDHETDLAWGDLDGDGDVDLVVVRSEPFIVPGKRSNVLLLNEAGVLTDRTGSLAASSDVPGDQGFLTPTQDRDVVLADVDGDGWLDVVTAADLWQPGDPKHLTHPRILRNLGEDGSAWLGLRHEDARIPQLLIGGQPGHPRFMSVAAADVDADGDLDLYFGDQDFIAQGVDEPAAEDMNDRLLVNDGSGVFSDGTASALTAAMVDSTFHNAVVLEDFNADGLADLLQEDGYFDPTTIVYNRPITPGVFAGTDQVFFGPGYFADSGDLNDDGRPDIIISSNTDDRFLLNTGVAPNGQAGWSPATAFEFLVGGDQGIGGNNLVADLDGDGWDDVLIADVDPEIPGYDRRLTVFHNRGGTPGGTDIVLREERQSTNDDDWVGVRGLTAADLAATHDMAVFDVDGDGLDDLILSQLAGTVLWRQVSAWTDLGQALAGAGGPPRLQGLGGLAPGSQAGAVLTGGAPAAPATLVAGLGLLQLPFKGGTLVPTPDVLISGLVSDLDGALTLVGPWPQDVPSGLTVVLQLWLVDGSGPAGLTATNGISQQTP